jgi:hypothetical protein
MKRNELFFDSIHINIDYFIYLLEHCICIYSVGIQSSKLTLPEHLRLLRGSCCSIFSFRRSNLWMIVCFKVIKKIGKNEYERLYNFTLRHN